MKVLWNPWIIKDNTLIKNENNFEMAIDLNDFADYIIPENSEVYVCKNSDFFDNKANNWRNDIWNMIKERYNVMFYLYSNNLSNINEKLPDDWNEGYDNVVISLVTNTDNLDEKIDELLNAKALNKNLVISPLDKEVIIKQNLKNEDIQLIQVEGDTTENKSCDFDWIKSLQQQCKSFDISFEFLSTGNIFVMNGKQYKIKKEKQESQAKLANINHISKTKKIAFNKKEVCNKCKKIILCNLNNPKCNLVVK